MKVGLVQHYMSQKSLNLAQESQKSGVESPLAIWTNFLPFSTCAHSSTLNSESSWASNNPRWVFKFAVPPDRGLKSEDLGSIAIPGNVDDPMMLAKANGIVAMNNVIQNPAGKIVYDSAQDDDEWLISAVNAYCAQVMSVIQDFAAYYPEFEITQKSAKFVAKAKEIGWMAAGAWSMLMSSLSRDAQNMVTAPVFVSQPNMESISIHAENYLYGSLDTTMKLG